MRDPSYRKSDPRWQLSSQEEHPDSISAGYDAANKDVRRGSVQTQHYQRLREAIRAIIVDGAHPYVLCDVAAKAIAQGLPVDSHAIFADEKVLEVEARYICLAIPSLSNLHQDARLWLADRLKRDPDKIEGSIPFNFVTGGETVREDE